MVTLLNIMIPVIRNNCKLCNFHILFPDRQVLVDHLLRQHRDPHRLAQSSFKTKLPSCSVLLHPSEIWYLYSFTFIGDSSPTVDT